MGTNKVEGHNEEPVNYPGEVKSLWLPWGVKKNGRRSPRSIVMSTK